MSGRISNLLRRTASTLSASVQACFDKPPVEESVETYLADEFQSFVRGYSGVVIGITIASVMATFAISELFAWAQDRRLVALGERGFPLFP